MRGRVAAVLALGLSDARAWAFQERDFLQNVSVRAAHALDRAQAYQLAERARADAEDLRGRADLDRSQEHQSARLRHGKNRDGARAEKTLCRGLQEQSHLPRLYVGGARRTGAEARMLAEERRP